MTGDRIHFWRLLEPEHRAAEAFCRRLAGDRAEGDDLYQDSLVSALHAFKQLRDHESFRPCLYRTIVNRFKSRRRSRWFRNRRPLTAAVEATRVGTDPQPLAAARRRLESALAQLSAGDRALIILFEVDGWTVAELARLSGKTEGSIKTRLSRARGRMRRFLIRQMPESARTNVERSPKTECVALKSGGE